MRGPRFGPQNNWGVPPRQLFDKDNPRWGINAEGIQDYLTSPDPLYNPFYQLSPPRVKGSFATHGYYGYTFMYSPVEEPLIEGFYNDHVRHGAKMPLCSDLFGPQYESGQFGEVNSDQCAVLYLDGGVVVYPQSELASSRRDFNARFRFLMQR